MIELRLILGDQLNHHHHWFQDVNKHVIYVMMEIRQETDYTKHHIQKIVGFFLAMREFSKYLIGTGHRIHYLTIDDPLNTQDLLKNLTRLIDHYKAKSLSYQEPDEYRLDQQLKNFHPPEVDHITCCNTEHFFTERGEAREFFKAKKSWVMEYFYRHLRKKHHILMDEQNKPTGGQWNYDINNRKAWKGAPSIPRPLNLSRNISKILELIHSSGIQTIGNVDKENFNWPVTRKDALNLLDYFTQHLLPHFGTYQDAMATGEPFMFHSRLSFAMNVKLISPLEVINTCLKARKNSPHPIDISQIEGFVRQILGWREYIRGVYWSHMPNYENVNYFNHKGTLPHWYWTGKTHMRCLSEAIGQSLKTSYAHHIQRLMITGNFALLAGVSPNEVDEWYLGIYIDAIQWVELPNTRGMSQFSDGGVMATKPYISSANYIQKMSNHCKTCPYNPKERMGPKACPFNALYWHFLMRHESKLRKNHRLAMPYKLLDKMPDLEKKKLKKQGDLWLERIDHL